MLREKEHFMAIRQTRIFVNSAENRDDWAETLMGRVIRPVVSDFTKSIHWFWFSRYDMEVNRPGEERGDCDFERIPDAFKRAVAPGGPRHRSLRFRFEIEDSAQQAFEDRLRELIEGNGYAISGTLPYSEEGDLGSNRHLGNENRQPERRSPRARFVTHVYQSICELALDALVESEPTTHRFRFERNDHENNPHRSTFETIHHMLCNITSVPVAVWLLPGVQVLSPQSSASFIPREFADGTRAMEVFLHY
jgi:hypothetical protein